MVREMLRRVEVVFKEGMGNGGSAELGRYLGAALQAAAGDDYCRSIADLPVKPYSQGVYFSPERGRNIWCINTINDECYERMVLSLTDIVARTGSALSGNLAGDSVVERIILCDERDDREFAHRYFLVGNDERTAEVEFLSPCVCVPAERAAFPEPAAILSSMYQKGQRLLPISERLSPKDFDRLTQIASYDTASVNIKLNGGVCSGFVGRIAFSFSGTLPMRNACRLLFAYAGYVGIGVGCERGLGLVNVTLKQE